MSNCNGCCGSCGSCGSCGASLLMTQEEVALLRRFGEIPFLPVARKASDMTPVCLEGDNLSDILACLEKKGLIDIDYHAPLKGFDYSAYSAWPLHGSMALTARGQQVLDTLELQGADWEG